jgi:hypothetical protein
MALTIEHAEHVSIHFGTVAQAEATALLSDLVTGTLTPTATAEKPPVALGEYWPGQGGIYVATVPPMLGMPGRHLIAGTQEVGKTWGPYDHDAEGASSHVDGVANTKALLARSEEFPAAAWCAAYQADGHSDFHLPSRFDLLMAYLSAPNAFEKEGWYWSSTQVSRHSAFVLGFAYGSSGWDAKGSEWRVRPFRWIHFNA